MSRSHGRSQAFGLLVALLCVAALVSAAGSAQAAPTWKLNGTGVTAELSPAVAVNEIENNTATVLFTTAGGTNVEILCTTLQPINVKLKPEGVVAFESQLKFTGCITKLNGKLSGGCEPLSGGGEPGVIKTQSLKGVLVEHEGSSIALFEPTTGTTIAWVEMGELCALGEELNIAGKITLKDTALETEAKEHLASQGPLTSFTVLGRPATIDGSMVFRLAGVHEGMTWSGGNAIVEPNLTWHLKGSNIASLTPLVAVKEVEGEDVTLSTKVGGAKVEVLCTGVQLANIKLESKGVVAPGSQVKFSGCLTKLNGTTSGACEPSNEGIEPGAIASESLEGLLVSHEKAGIVRFEPTTGETLAVIETSESCSIGEKIALLGKATLKDASLATESETHLVSVGPLTELWLISKTEEHQVTLTGSSIVKLASSHSGLLWSGGEEIKPPTPGWKLEGANVTAELSPAVAVQEIESKTATLLFTTAGGTKVEFLCTALQPISVKLKPEGIVGFESKLKFTGCIVKLNGTLSPKCEPVSGGEPGVIKTESLKGALVEHEGTSIVRFEPTTGTTIALTELGELCSLSEEVTIAGKLVFKDSALGTEAAEHLASEGPLTSLTALGRPATIDGSMVFRLAGIHEGMTWSGTA